MVTVYTKNDCKDCRSTKELMESLDIDFSIINMSEDPSALKVVKAKGFRAAPVVITDEDSWSGYKEDKIRALVSGPQEEDDTWDF